MSAQQATPQEFDFQKIAEESCKVLDSFMEQHDMGLESVGHINRAFFDMAEKWMQDPTQAIHRQVELYQSYIDLWGNIAERMLGNTPEPLATPQKGDRRFHDKAWEENFVFDYIKQSYLLTSNWVTDNIRDTKGVDDQTRRKVDFYTRQWLDALSPTNFPITNPEVIQKTVESKGENLVKGLKNLLRDLERGDGKLKISMTDYDAFEIGKNIAVTEGSVVYQNDLIQLIQYKPKTEKVSEKPLLVFPPFINKFYILDLQKENSFVKYAVEECGQTVFMVSWKNVDESYRNYGWEEYIQQGVLDAVEQVLAITKQPDLNAIGYCIGGTLLSSTLAYMSKKKDKRINSATFFTTLMDFTDAGEMGVFIDDDQVSNIERGMKQKGYLCGSEMAGTFSMLRSNDLIWSFVINNYMLGQDPFPFDLLYWNDDPTRLPEKLHSFYLNNMYLQNNLVKKNKLTLLGEKIDLSQISQPIYMVSAINDHITPWKSCFAPMNNMKGDVRFILGKAGHVAGVACPPGNPKRAYWAGSVNTDDSDEWLADAEKNNDSWWVDWNSWINERSGKKVVPPKTAGDAKHKVLMPAPGTYVKEV